MPNKIFIPKNNERQCRCHTLEQNVLKEIVTLKVTEYRTHWHKTSQFATKQKYKEKKEKKVSVLPNQLKVIKSEIL